MNNFDQNNFDSDLENQDSLNNMDYQKEQDLYDYETSDMNHNNGWTRKPNAPINAFAMFARSLGVFSIFCAVFSLFLGSFVCGGMAIVLAILSKGYNTKMERNAKFGLVAAILAIVFQISILTVNVYNIINVPEYREHFNTLYEQIYGTPVDDSITELLDQLSISNLEGGIL